MRLPLALAAAVLVAACCSKTQAQPGYGGGYYGGGHGGGGTVGSSYAHGYADIVRSAGEYNVMTSKAHNIAEDTRKKYIENRMQWTQTYFEMQKMNRAYRKEKYDELHPHKTMEDFARYAGQAATKRLRSTELDPITGYLAWPRVLSGDQYSELRKDLDKLYAERANRQGAIGNDAYYQIAKKTEEMTAILVKEIREKKYRPADSIKARNFLKSLGHEARFPAG